MPNLTFETKVWEKDWEIILSGNRLRKIIDRCNTDFSEKIVFINNVKNPDYVQRACDRLIKNGTIDSFYLVDVYATEALQSIGLSEDDFGIGFRYSIAELVSIYLCKTNYLLHFSGDSFPQKSNENWTQSMIDTITNRKDIVCANLCWNGRYDEAENQSVEKNDDFFIGHGFSDQMYLIESNRFKDKIYAYSHESSNVYPEYGGELFEKRVNSWMRTLNLLRATHRRLSYTHKNFSKNPNLRKLHAMTGKL